jgi:tetratricopeptide (TPR) repeat protein
MRRGDGSDAEPLYQRAAKLLEGEPAPADGERGAILGNLGALYASTGRYEEALPLLDQAVSLLQESYGPRNANVARLHHAAGSVQLERGRLALARERYERALVVGEASFGAGHPELARTHDALGVVSMREGRADEAEQHMRRAVEIQQAAGGGLALGVYLSHLGETLAARGERVEAASALRQALAIVERELSPGDPVLVATRASYERVRGAQ